MIDGPARFCVELSGNIYEVNSTKLSTTCSLEQLSINREKLADGVIPTAGVPNCFQLCSHKLLVDVKYINILQCLLFRRVFYKLPFLCSVPRYNHCGLCPYYCNVSSKPD